MRVAFDPSPHAAHLILLFFSHQPKVSAHLADIFFFHVITSCVSSNLAGIFGSNETICFNGTTFGSNGRIGSNRTNSNIYFDGTFVPFVPMQLNIF